MSIRPRVRLPETVRAGEVIEIKTLVSHIMETGQRRDKDGQPIPRKIINAFTATFDGREVFAAALYPGTSANPYLVFHLKVPGPGELVLTWTEDGGQQIIEKIKVAVEA